MHIPVMLPKLPRTERLVPYLEAIDHSRIYSNFGPLTQSLEHRLADRFGIDDDMLTTVANATLGLTLAIRSQDARPGTLCAIPAWTFIASVHAVVMAGLIPYFVDVNQDTWAMDAGQVANEIANAPGPVGAVMPIVPFGRPIDVAAWDDFRSSTGVPVVIDAAAGFDSVVPGGVPTVVSLHATKVIGTGEGGFIMSTDQRLIRDIRTRSNFGFAGTRESTVPSANAKLSEYNAAVGLAALDEWAENRSEWMKVAAAYRDELPETNQFRFQHGFGETWIASTCVVSVGDNGATRVEDALAKTGIATRRWWGSGAHLHRSSSSHPRAPLPATERLANSTIGLPFFHGLQPREIKHIAGSLRQALNG